MGIPCQASPWSLAGTTSFNDVEVKVCNSFFLLVRSLDRSKKSSQDVKVFSFFLLIFSSLAELQSAHKSRTSSLDRSSIIYLDSKTIMTSFNSAPAPTLEHVANIHLDLAAGIAGGNTPKGTTIWIPITGGTITSPDNHEDDNTNTTTPRLDLRVLPGGGDYPTLHAHDGILSLDISFVATSAPAPTGSSNANVNAGAGDLFRFQNTGFITLDDEVADLLLRGCGSDTVFGAQDVRESITCNTSSEPFRWLNFATLVAQGRLLARDGQLGAIEFRVFRFVARG
ncbi:hypothetical protein PVAG01_09841 [Phlyctema vagabunda]|uniref:Uncharacterized protein n=1 Tax=Phlyctema vagabunda TaxID=108571 RepID=A0ABR4P479_9HELO